jgi:DNA gyrase/topoisomerase IV subunit A
LFSLQSTRKHQTRISSCSSAHSADTTQESARAAQSRRNQRLANWLEFEKAAKSHRNLEKFFAEFLSMTSSQAKLSNAMKRNARQSKAMHVPSKD